MFFNVMDEFVRRDSSFLNSSDVTLPFLLQSIFSNINLLCRGLIYFSIVTLLIFIKNSSMLREF